ncbi:protein OSB1, mitochondrial-like [Dioscorea cayenensis subsp. rotundata]|uniref:Protein OSB1, mitochondrial-like n=1 Tax=Dioscorea cayennensis subsp. rotundata TaxID=55577 RepID=A0AB40CI26_DIOCR|nr:protein OSB1, mitochondrial-like [Dioscorea cayenensis subsp. rotundata]
MGSRLRRHCSIAPASLRLRCFSSATTQPESIAYRRSMLRRPETVSLRHLPLNSCSLIGSVARHLKPYGGGYQGFGVYTFLDVKPSSLQSSCSSFQILLEFKEKLAEISLKHLKPNDLIYVQGCLTSYEKVDASGSHEIFHKVVVKDLSYITVNTQNKMTQKPEAPGENDLARDIADATNENTPSSQFAPNDEKDHRDRLHLWQIFFANPHEWWDNRKRKLYPRAPDFKHKDTKECLWLDPNDPPWVRKQLELYDSKMAMNWQRNPDCRLNLHSWKSDDFS